MTVAQALMHIASGNSDAALRSCEHVAHHSPLASYLVVHLAEHTAEDVYTNPNAFERFISGGSNVKLYESTITALAEVNEQQEPKSLIDIGCGDGRITAATIPATCETVHLLEPSDALLALAKVAVDGVAPEVVATGSTLQDYLIQQPGQTWDHAQATFALHNLGSEDRPAALAKLIQRVQTLSVVEFDVPDFGDKSAEHATYAAEVYELGVAEYADDPEVINGFLLPVLLGQFAPGRQRHTYEQSASSWVAELSEAGLRSVTTTPIYEYWWADAVLITGVAAVAG